MAVRGEDGCDIVRNEALKNKIRALWIRFLKRHGSKQGGLDIKAEGQPFFLEGWHSLAMLTGGFYWRGNGKWAFQLEYLALFRGRHMSTKSKQAGDWRRSLL